MVESYFKTVDFPEQICYVQVGAGLFPSFVNKFAILPLYLCAKQYFNPVEDRVLDVFEEGEVLLTDNIAVVIVVADSLSHHQFVPVLVVRK